MCSRRDLFALLLLAAWLACQKQPVEHDLPAALLGVWATEDPRYADRFFEIRGDETVRFGQGEAGVFVSPVTAVESERDGTSLIFHITHLNEVGDPYTFSLRYDPARHDELSLLNQAFVLWKRSPSASTSSR